MRYLVLLRHGMGIYTVALKLSRSRQGHISCVETLPRERPNQPAAGMTWRRDGSFRFTTASGARRQSNRTPLAELKVPELAYAVPGLALLDPRLPYYTRDMRGATVQIGAEAVAAEPHLVELQLLVTPRGHVPEHRETAGDRLIEEGDPSIWMVLVGPGDDVPETVAARRPRPKPFLRTSAEGPVS